MAEEVTVEIIQGDCREVLDPFGGIGTVGVVARKAGRKAILIELNLAYVEMMRERMAQRVLL